MDYISGTTEPPKMKTVTKHPQGETPEYLLTVDKHEDMKALIKVLSNINNNLQEINKTLRRMK